MWIVIGGLWWNNSFFSSFSYCSTKWQDYSRICSCARWQQWRWYFATIDICIGTSRHAYDDILNQRQIYYDCTRKCYGSDATEYHIKLFLCYQYLHLSSISKMPIPVRHIQLSQQQQHNHYSYKVFWFHGCSINDIFVGQFQLSKIIRT